MKILFVHNSIPDYRVPWFQKISKLDDVDFLFTNVKAAENTYGKNVDYSQIENKVILPKGINGYYKLIKYLKKMKDYDFIELPPIDTFGEYIKGILIFLYAKMSDVKTGYFWEKWEAPLEKQPLKKKIKNKIQKGFAKTLFLKVDIIFSVGKKNTEYFLNAGIPKKKLYLIPDVSLTPECEYIDIREKYKIGKDKIILLYFGRIIEEKGLDILIEAFEKINNQNTFLIVAGDGEMKEKCQRIMIEKNINNMVFTGKIHPSLRGNYFRDSDIFVFPRTFRNGTTEAWGLTVNEAVQHKCYIIATEAVGSAYELIKNGENGVLIKAESEKELRKAIETSLTTYNNKSKLKVDEKLISIYSYDNMASKYLQIVRECLYNN